MKKTDGNPLQQARRCSASSKRTGLPCNAPAVRGWSVCRMHGARGGAPSGVANGNYRHGTRTKKAANEAARIKELLSAWKETLEFISPCVEGKIADNRKAV